MKKIISVVLALVVIFAMATTAMAAPVGTCSFDQKTNKLSWDVTSYNMAVTIYVDGNKVGGAAEGTSMDLVAAYGIKPGTYTVYAQDLSGEKAAIGTITIIDPSATTVPTEAPTEAPTAEPTATPVVTEAPTAEPTEEPTEAPTAEPTAKPTEKPTKKPVVEDDDVPKTGDTASYVVVISVMALAAAYLVSRRFGREN